MQAWERDAGASRFIPPIERELARTLICRGKSNRGAKTIWEESVGRTYAVPMDNDH
jgi:hypothetical protein